MEEVLLEASGINGRVVLFKNIVRIQRFGLLGFLRRPSGVERDIVISQIKSIHFGKAGWLKNGYLGFDVTEDNEPGEGEPGGAGGELVVTFRRGQQRLFEGFRGAVEERITTIPAKASTAAVSALDDLDKLASLRDRRVITEEEFNRKKSQLLGL